jgi:hypothetical protein
MKSIGPLYVDSIKLKHPVKPLFEWGWSQETSYPYRESKVCAVFWIPFVRRGYALGIWGKPIREEQALSKAVKFGRNNPNDIPVDDIRKYVTIQREEGW